MTVRNYRISVDGQFYTGEKECELSTYHTDPWSSNSFQTKRVSRNVLTFEPKENNNFKVITGSINLLSETKKIVEFVRDTKLMSGSMIQIEAEPYTIPLTLNINYFLDIEVENSKLKVLMAEMKTQLDIATDLGQKRFEETEKMREGIKKIITTTVAIGNMETCRPLENYEMVSLLRDVIE